MSKNSDILIYIQKVKAFFDKRSKEKREEFFKEEDEGLFYNKLTDIATNNVKETGYPTLTKEQFETLKHIVNSEPTVRGEGFVFYESVGMIYLN